MRRDRQALPTQFDRTKKISRQWEVEGGGVQRGKARVGLWVGALGAEGAELTLYLCALSRLFGATTPTSSSIYTHAHSSSYDIDAPKWI